MRSWWGVALLALCGSVVTLHVKSSPMSETVGSSLSALYEGLGSLEAAHIRANAFSNATSFNSSVGFCDRHLSASYRRLFSRSDCNQLKRIIHQTSDVTPPVVADICDSMCFSTVASELSTVSKLGCLHDIEVAKVPIICPDCTTAAAKTCVKAWLDSSCTAISNSACEPFAFCLFSNIGECTTSVNSVITFTVSLPLTMDPEEFQIKHSSEYAQAAALSANVPVNTVRVITVVRGSIIVTATITVQFTESGPAYKSLAESLSSTTFRDNLNAALYGELSIASATLVSLTTTGQIPPGVALPATQTPNPVLSPSTLHCVNNCSYHGECERVTASSSRGRCVCDKLFGRSSTTVPQDCSEQTLDMCPDQCSGRGMCTPSNSSMVCNCYDGFYGETCNRWNRCHDLKYCNGHGTCTRSYPRSEYEEVGCICDSGYTGNTCHEFIPTCPHQCSAHGVCTMNGSGHRSCACDTGFGGEGCSRVVLPYCEHSCSGLGTCLANLTCDCRSGASGVDCSEITNDCGDCHHGFCREGRCECLSGYTGPQCNVYNATQDESCQSLSFCNGRGICHRSVQINGLYEYGCTCFEGFSGDKCAIVDVNYEDQCPNHCSSNGKCVLLQSPHCVCEDGFTGTDCSQASCPTIGGEICSGHGVCERSADNSFHCVCDGGYENDAKAACEVSLCPSDCSGRGRCNSSGSCICDTGFTGFDCSVVASGARQVLAASGSAASAEVREDEEDGTVLDVSSCLNSCSRHGDCVMGKCACYQGRGGADCSEELPSSYEENDDLDKLDLLEIKSESMAALWN